MVSSEKGQKLTNFDRKIVAFFILFYVWLTETETKVLSSQGICVISNVNLYLFFLAPRL